MKKTTLTIAGIILLALILMLSLPKAGAYNEQYFDIECGQEYILIEEEGYKIYEAWLTWTDTWRGLELTSMTAKYWNGVKTINSRVGFSDQRESMFSPLTCTQLESKKFGTFVSIPTEEIEVVEIDEEKENLKKQINQALSWIEELQKQLYNLK